MKTGRSTVVLLIFILAISFLLRIYGVTAGLPTQSHTYTYNGDEYSHINILKNLDLARLKFDNKYYPGLFYVLALGGYLKILTVGRLLTIVNNADFYRDNIGELRKIYLYGRLTSVFIGTLCVYLIFLLGAQLYGEKVGLLSALALGILPSHVIYSHYMEPDVLGSLFVIASFICYFNIVKSKDLKWYLLGGLFTGLAVSTKFSTVPFVAILPLAHFLCIDKDLRGRFRKSKVLDKKMTTSILTAILSLCITSPTVIFNTSSYINQILHVKKFYVVETGSASPLNLFFYPLRHQFYHSMGAFLLGLCLFGIMGSIVRRRAADILLLSGLVLFYPIVIKIMGKAGVSHLIPIMPVMVIFGARCTLFDLELPNPRMKIYWRALKAVTISAVLLFTMVYTFSLSLSFAGNNERQEASDWIEQNLPTGSTIGIVRMPTPFRHPDIVAREIALSETPQYKFFIVDTESEYNPRSSIHKKIILERKGQRDLSPYCLLLAFKPDYILANEVTIEDIQADYELIKVFNRKVEFLGMNFDLQPRGGDLLYIIDIYIFKRRIST